MPGNPSVNNLRASADDIRIDADSAEMSSSTISFSFQSGAIINQSNTFC
jgi:hypothetical protein